MFSPADNRARFQDKAYSHPEPRAEEAFNETVSPQLVRGLSELESWFRVRGLEADFAGVCEAVFEVTGYPMTEKTNWTSPDHNACIRMYQRARRAFDEQHAEVRERVA